MRACGDGDVKRELHAPGSQAGAWEPADHRRAIWQRLGRLRSEEGTTLLLTTHHLEEAAGCDRVAFMSRGRLIGQGSPSKLIAALGEYVLEVETESPAETASHLRPRFGEPLVEGNDCCSESPAGRCPWTTSPTSFGRMPVPSACAARTLNDVYLWIHHDPPDGTRKSQRVPHEAGDRRHRGTRSQAHCCASGGGS